MPTASSSSASEAAPPNPDVRGRLATGLRRAKERKTPQETIDEFWDKFTTKTPGKATTIIPHNEYADKVARRSKKAIDTNTQTSYDEAAAVCKAKVAKIVKECRRVNQKYRDPHFDLELDLKWGRRDTLKSLSNVKDKVESQFNPKSVKRVVDIFDDPKFYIEGPSSNDVRQGRDGDCWFLAALCTLSNKPSLIERLCVARDEQVGVYGFVFHRDGEWISEIIDDKLFLTKPDFDESFLERMLWEDRERINSEEQYRKVYQSGSGSLYFAQCEHENETWLPLLEKAYAKAHGDYASIEGGFTGEGIEDLTGGVTSELYTADILDKEYFWKEELMKVNDEFLFGCSTGVWGTGWGERKGIIELHAYSIMRAVEIDGQRLVLLKNPWGKGEWTGPWSDGSREWTAEWLLKLDHRFGDDGNFWISYDDLLRKYQDFERTRLFGPEWKVTSLWTTLSVPWTLDYHDTYFAFTLNKAGPVVIVLSQLDERYYCGLEGQYQFQVKFRLHKNGQEDYVVRSIGAYGQNRSVNVELELEKGEYTVLLKIDATRDMNKLPVEEVVRNNARTRRDKLVAIGMSYDLAHSKGRVSETPEEKQSRENAAKRKKEKELQKLKKEIMDSRRRDHYLRAKQHKKSQEKKAKARAKKAEKARLAAARKKKSAPKEDGPEAKKNEPKQEPSPDPAVQSSDLKQEPVSDSSTDPSVKTPPTEPDDAVAEPPAKPEEKPAVPSAEGPAPTSSGDSSADGAAKKDAQDETAKEGGESAVKAEDAEVKVEEGAVTAGTAGGEKEGAKEAEEKAGEEQKEGEAEAGAEAEDADGDSADESDLSSVSEISDAALEIEFEARAQIAGESLAAAAAAAAVPPAPLGDAEYDDDDDDEFASDPWNAVLTVGLRIYHKVAPEDRDAEVVTLRVVRPDLYAEKEEGDGEGAKGGGAEGGAQPGAEEPPPKSSKGLDVDDSAKDATLEGDSEQREKSILSQGAPPEK